LDKSGANTLKQFLFSKFPINEEYIRKISEAEFGDDDKKTNDRTPDEERPLVE